MGESEQNTPTTGRDPKKSGEPLTLSAGDIINVFRRPRKASQETAERSKPKSHKLNELAADSLSRVKPAVESAAANAARIRQEVKSKASETAEQIIADPKVQKVQLQVKQVVENPGETATSAVLASRESRIETEQKNKLPNPIQKFFRHGIVGWTAQTIVQSIPTPLGYGPGDLITAANAISGVNVLTGEKLDKVDRVLYGIATAIPYVPGTILVTPIKALRRGIEDYVHARKSSNDQAAQEALDQVQSGVSQLNQLRKEQPSSPEKTQS